MFSLQCSLIGQSFVEAFITVWLCSYHVLHAKLLWSHWVVCGSVKRRPDGGLAGWRTLTSHSHMRAHTQKTHKVKHGALLQLVKITWLHSNTPRDRGDTVSGDLPSVVWWHICHKVFVQNKLQVSLSCVAIQWRKATHMNNYTAGHAFLLISHPYNNELNLQREALHRTDKLHQLTKTQH